jgi:hypothetical protein
MAVATALAVPSVALAAEPGNNTFAGATPLTAGTSRSGTVNSATDYVDVFSIVMTAGQKVGVRLNAKTTADLDAYIFTPDSPSMVTAAHGSDTEQPGYPGIYPEDFTYVAPVTGTYFIAVWAERGRADYTLSTKVGTASPDDELPTSPAIPSSPATGTLNRYGDENDVFTVGLEDGESIRMNLTGPKTADFDAFVYDANATSVYLPGPVAKSDKTGSSESLLYKAKSGGIHRVRAQSFYGSGSYTLSWATGILTTAKLSGPGTIGYSREATLTGSLVTDAGAPLTGESVLIERMPYGSSSWITAVTTSVGSDGSFIATVTPSVKTKYRIRYVDPRADDTYLGAKSAAITVAPKVYLSTPWARTPVRKGATFTTGGSIKPRQRNGSQTVRVVAQRLESGKWVTRRTVLTTNRSYDGFSRYSAKISLPYKGTWRLFAKVPNGRYAATRSDFRKVIVK